MSRALVLGGGGPVGIGWQAGLLTGLLDSGVAIRDADFVVGTSAGSVVGAQLTSGRTLSDVVPPISQRPAWASADPGGPSPDLAELIACGGAAEVTEDDFIARFAFLSGDWPSAFRCTAVGVDSGRFAIWDGDAGVEVERAVASSCSVPGLSPAVTIGGERYMDGGARDMLNADLAVGHDAVVAVSCVVLEPPDGARPELLATLLPAVRSRIDDLRASGSAVEVVEPPEDMVELSGCGAYLMGHTRTAAAFDAGVRQGKVEAERLASLWIA